ncbi:MAG: hypothetical protein R3Y13_01975 [bacterium]
MNNEKKYSILKGEVANSNSIKLLKELEEQKVFSVSLKKCASPLELLTTEHEVKHFFLSKIHLKDRMVRWMSIKDYKMANEELKLSGDQKRDFYKTVIQLKDCFRIPAEIQMDIGHASICLEYFFDKPHLVGPINLSLINEMTLKSSYTHECTHALLEREPGSYRDLYDREFLSIFLEKAVLKKDSVDFKLTELNRWISIRTTDFENINQINNYSVMYYNSTVKAIYLYYLYRNMSSFEKQVLMRLIKEILEGRATINMLYNRYNINWDNDDLYNVAIESMKNAKKTYIDFRKNPSSYKRIV